MSDDKVWVVSHGSYSDYRVDCACRSEADAEAVAAKFKADKNGWLSDACVESLPFVTPDIEKLSILRLGAYIFDDGTVSKDDEHSYTMWPFEEDRYPWMHDRPRACSWQWRRTGGGGTTIGGHLNVLGTDHERVRKVYSDRKAMFMADDAARLTPEAKGGT